ncbi:MAG: GTPase ObgE [Rhodothermales bacterium]|nr:GTPase ObgE [Rhodothermales bacterium]
MKFVDYVTISVRSGKGGAGAISFRRAKYEPNGGPDGGDGGAGGSVILEGDTHLYTLLDLRYNRHHFADNGKPGSGANKQGRSGDDIVLRVPMGTVVRNLETDEIIGEIVAQGQQLMLAQGGRGGKGNTFFKTSTHQTPRYSQPGEPSIELEVVLELKLLADVGLVGFPNAGKSTLVASLSAARPKIADYPFTTLEPALGVVRVEEYKSFVIADIPGIIEGASEGRGLGLQFLKHIERNAILLFVIPVTDDDPGASYRILLNELEAFNADLLRKPRMVALSKIDLLPVEDADEWITMVRAGFPANLHIVPISAVAQKGLERLRMDLWNRLEKSKG